ncbi:uncharacterized protein LOC112037833 [Quercus suber]|uniref:uncharacterized protein LOC112037833 n=1 Tax=Quercus suber TaxID=58331 RepID=UPI000CE24F0A|nr:uncharacterized protein LOC112037833 [Quercus suber]
MWLLHPDFYRIIREAWPEGANLTVATTEFTRKAKKWNYEVFGNLFAKKKRVLARLNEYSSILLQEEEFWALKSRINVAAFGDRNTSYFYMNTMIGTGWEVFDEDVRSGLWALKPFKAPGPDGLHAGFYQYFWHEVGNSVCEEVKNIFKDGIVPNHLNDTLVTLIPKCKSPESLNNYRPINLCNSVYKFVSKILVERIRPYLNKLISPVQIAFVPGRKGLDNVLVAQELFHVLDKKKGKEGYMAIKVDLEKAYDRMEWCFIHKVLHAFYFPQNLIRVIMSCVTSTKVSILFNGEKLEAFNPSRDEDACVAITEVLDEFCEESGQKAVALPTHLCDKLDKINRDFLWGSMGEKRRLHLVGWSKIIRPKEEEGLGIQAAKFKNLALLAKLNWRLNQEKESLWAKVILKKYCSMERMRARDPDKLPCSPNWRAIKAGFSNLCGWKIDMKLSKLFLDLEQRWKWEALSFEFLVNIKDRIKAIPRQLVGRGEDVIMWKLSKDGEFTTNSAYTWLNGS